VFAVPALTRRQKDRTLGVKLDRAWIDAVVEQSPVECEETKRSLAMSAAVLMAQQLELAGRLERGEVIVSDEARSLPSLARELRHTLEKLGVDKFKKKKRRTPGPAGVAAAEGPADGEGS